MKNIANKFNRFLAVFGLALLAASCSVSLDDKTAAPATYGNPTKTVVKLSMKDDARAALPVMSGKDFTSYSLEISSDEDSDFFKYYDWSSYTELTKAAIELSEGKYIFSFDAYYDNVVYRDVKEVEVKSGTNRISFNVSYYGISGYSTGTGNLKIDLNCAEVKAKVVKAGLYTTGNFAVTDFADEIIASGASVSSAEYSKQNIPSGNYIAKFKFYSDNEGKLLLGTYQEYVVILTDKNSTSSITCSGLSGLYTISYVLNGKGTFAPEAKPEVIYTRLSGVVVLIEPVASNDKYEFAGWYTNSDLTGAPVISFAASESKNLTFYAKWRTKKTVTFNGKGKNFIIPESEAVSVRTVTLKSVDDNTSILPTTAELGLSTAGKAFLGWATSDYTEGNEKLSYTDGQKITLTADNITLYAVYSSSSLNPDENDKTDTDGDGLTDYKEIYVYHTDPFSKDTDGDGYEDRYEVNYSNLEVGAFNPRTADIPEITIELAGEPVIYRNYTVSNAKGETVSKTINETSGGSYTSTNANASTKSTTHGWNVGVKIGYSSKTGASIEGSFGYNGSKTSSATATYTTASAKNWSTAISNGKTYTSTETQTNNGGQIIVPVKITNSGNITYTVDNMVISLKALKVIGENEYVTVGSFPAIDKITVINGSAEGVTRNLTLTLNNDQLELLLKNSAGFKLDLESSLISTQHDGKTINFTETYTQTKAKCADLCISFGALNKDKPDRNYKISTKTKYNPTAANLESVYTPISLKEALEYVGIREDSAENPVDNNFKLVLDNGKIKGIGGVVASEYSPDHDWYIMVTHVDIDGKINQKFYTNHTGAGDQVSYDYDINDILIKPQDIVSVFYDVDKDNDGVSATEEAFYGTSDENVDSDGDGLTDFEEIYGFLKNGTLFRTNPADEDTDGDAYFHPDNAADWNDKNDENPVASSSTDKALMKEILCSVTGKDDSFTAAANPSEGNYLVEQTAYEYLYLKPVPRFKGSAVSYKKVDAYGKPTGDYISTDGLNQIKITLAPEKQNEIMIKLISPDGTGTNEFVVKVNSEYVSYEDNVVTSSSKSWKSLEMYLEQYYDCRLDMSKRLENVNSTGFLFALSKNNSQVEEIDYALITSSADYDSGATIPEGSGWKFFRVPGDQLMNSNRNVFKFDITDYREKTYFKLFRYQIKADRTVSVAAMKSVECKMARPSKCKLTLSLDSVYDVEDKDGGYEPDYKCYFYASGVTFDKALSLSDFSEKMCDNNKHHKRYFNFGTRKTQGEKPSLGSGDTYSIEFDISNLQDGQSFEFHIHAWELDSGPDDNLGDHKKTVYYSKAENRWYISATDAGSGNKSADSSRIVDIGAGYKSDFLCVRNSDGDIDLNFGIKWEYVWN